MKHTKIKTKGQAALEFMMTYGWALLLLTAFISGLVYVMPHPKVLTSNKCIFGPAIPCLGVQLTQSNLTIVLSNKVGGSIYNISSNALIPAKVPCQVSSTSVINEEKLIIVCNNTGSNGMNLSDDTRIKVEIKYQKNRGGYNQSIIGEIYAKYN